MVNSKKYFGLGANSPLLCCTLCSKYSVSMK
jgi:hypothetical protein